MKRAKARGIKKKKIKIKCPAKSAELRVSSFVASCSTVQQLASI
jgi:hypothetical protein